MTDISVPWGREELKIDLPANWTIQQVAQGQFRTAPENWKERLAMSLCQPDSGLPLPKLLAARQHGRIVIVLEDITRHSPLEAIVDVLLAELRHCKIKDEQIGILFANGMHPAMTPEQVASRLGKAADGIKWRCNPWHDRSAYVRLKGKGLPDLWVDKHLAAADLRIAVSAVTPHLQAGFGGGYKMFFPGCANRGTIRGLHRLGVDRVPRPLAGTEAQSNPMRQAIDAAGQILDANHGTSFFVHYLLDQNDLPSFIAAGEPMSTQRMVAKQCAVDCGVVISAPADVGIINAYPRDFDIWQSFKCIANTRWAVRADGIIICLTRCEGGMNNVRPPAIWPAGPAWTRKFVKLLGADNIASMLIRFVPGLAGDAAFFVRLAAQTAHRNPIFMVAPPLAAAGQKFPSVEIMSGAEQAVRAADAILGPKPQRVVVFPTGGITYPITPGGRIG
ncbi:MAG: DUF2088 domain-containing protein [Planctomycetes bacterium]|nr:DUF2088 domain-containing protein [Planctomycetota bacterium]